MKNRILFSAVTALLLLSNCMTVCADQIEKDFAVEKPAAEKPNPYEDALFEPYRFNNYIPVFQKRPDFYAETTAPGRKKPVRATSTYSDGESYKVTEEGDPKSSFFEYDAQGNLVSVNEFLSDGFLQETAQYAYDTQGNFLSETGIRYWKDLSPTVFTTQYAYDKQGRLLSEINSADISKKYTYDKMGNLSTYTYTTIEHIGSSYHEPGYTTIEKRQYFYE